jgi:hypothetical protein
MEHNEFVIGQSFWTATGEWRCTDIGTRTIAAIKLNHPEDPSWYNGPPYKVCEEIFDEYDHAACCRTKDEYDSEFPGAPALIDTSGASEIVTFRLDSEQLEKS